MTDVGTHINTLTHTLTQSDLTVHCVCVPFPSAVLTAIHSIREGELHERVTQLLTSVNINSLVEPECR